MGIIRSPRPESNFYHLDKSISEDGRLSWAARGLLIYLLGKPDHWEVSVSHLIKQTDQAAKRSGRDAIYVILTELEATGYLQKQPARSKGGAFCGVDYTVSEIAVPMSSPPHTDFPDTAKPDTDGPDTANPTQVSIDYNQRLKKKQRPKKIPTPAPPPSAQKYISRLNPTVTPEKRSVKNVVERI